MAIKKENRNETTLKSDKVVSQMHSRNHMLDEIGKKKLYYPKVEIIHHHQQGSSKSLKLFIIHTSSAIKYFLKWGFNKKK